jgi:hypothetical protein
VVDIGPYSRGFMSREPGIPEEIVPRGQQFFSDSAARNYVPPAKLTHGDVGNLAERSREASSVTCDPGIRLPSVLGVEGYGEHASKFIVKNSAIVVASIN